MANSSHFKNEQISKSHIKTTTGNSVLFHRLWLRKILRKNFFITLGAVSRTHEFIFIWESYQNYTQYWPINRVQFLSWKMPKLKTWVYKHYYLVQREIYFQKRFDFQIIFNANQYYINNIIRRWIITIIWRTFCKHFCWYRAPLTNSKSVWSTVS